MEFEVIIDWIYSKGTKIEKPETLSDKSSIITFWISTASLGVRLGLPENFHNLLCTEIRQEMVASERSTTHLSLTSLNKLDSSHPIHLLLVEVIVFEHMFYERKAIEFPHAELVLQDPLTVAEESTTETFTLSSVRDLRNSFASFIRLSEPIASSSNADHPDFCSSFIISSFWDLTHQYRQAELSHSQCLFPAWFYELTSVLYEYAERITRLLGYFQRSSA